MRKYVIGFLAGCVFMSVGTVFADDLKSLIGQTVQQTYPVTINGEELEQPAAVIGDTSYLPVRVISEAAGLNVGFDETTGISLTKESVPTVEQSTTPTPTPTSTAAVSKPTKTTFKGMRAYEVNGSTYFSAWDYVKDKPNNKAFYVKDGTVTVTYSDGHQVNISSKDPDAIQIIEDETYINVKYYPE